MPSPAAATRERILDAAEAVFAELGFAGASTRRVADRAGITQPLVLHYFRTKQALFAEVLERAARRYDEEQAARWDLNTTSPEDVVASLHALFDWLGTNGQVLRLAAWARLEGVRVGGPASAKLWERVEQRLREGQEHGLVRPELDVRVALVLIDAAIKGFWDREAFYRGGGLLDERTHGVLRHELVRALALTLLEPAAVDEAMRARRTPLRRSSRKRS